MDVAERRVALLRRLEARWREAPPDQVIVAAGSTGSTKASADLLAAVAGAPRGAVVLPGLDLSLAEAAWQAADDQHPQASLQRLLQRAGVTRGQVRDWEGVGEAVDTGRWRRRVINEALRPADLTADWLEVIADLKRETPGVDPIAAGLEGLSLISAQNEEEAATAAALMLREALEVPDRTAALVTPDAALARRVEARLARWNITADSSVGRLLTVTPPGVLAQLVARTARDPVDPVVLLAIVKHPSTRLGLDPETLAESRERLELRGLRGPRPDGWAKLEERLGDASGAIDLARRLRGALEPVEALWADGAAAPALAARIVAEALVALSAGPDGETGDIWNGQAGAGLTAVLGRLIEESAALPPVTRSGFVQLLTGLLDRETVRPGGASHPRLRILGVLEARLIRADVLILAGLEEGVWPMAAPVDPFLSRPMRQRLGLPSPERRIGLAAHDFAQAACAPKVVLLHTERRGGAPAVQSRWLWRLRTLIEGAGLAAPERAEVLAWARALDAPIDDPPPSLRTALRPRPTPPVAARPRELPVTAVETWVRDPYAIYARRILKLRPLDPPDAVADARTRGVAIHAAFERFARAWPSDLPADAERVFEQMVMDELERAGMPRAAMAREAALARNVAPWVMDFERGRRHGARLLIEQTGSLGWNAPAGPFTVTARADRLELRGGTADVLDFKTGGAPSKKQVKAGLAPQLTLTAAILASGGFAEAGAVTPGELLYVRVTGRRPPGKIEARDEGEAPVLAEAALAGLKRRVASFDNEATPYVSWAVPQLMTDTGDYAGLARQWEWAVIGEVDE
jgi:ATP-dependent helicase/nuclease subunit B